MFAATTGLPALCSARFAIAPPAALGLLCHRGFPKTQHGLVGPVSLLSRPSHRRGQSDPHSRTRETIGSITTDTFASELPSQEVFQNEHLHKKGGGGVPVCMV
jgi:hypothetical protein